MDQPGIRRLDRRGGETITAIRPRSPRLLISAGALACALLLAVYPIVIGPTRRPVVAALSGIAIVIVLGTLAGRSKGAIPWGIAALGAAYAVALVERGGGVDPGAPLYAAVLFTCAELADWAADAPRSAAWDSAVALARLRALAVSTVTGAMGAAVVTIAADLAIARGGVAPTVLGTACTVVFVGLLALLARQAGSARTR